MIVRYLDVLRFTAFPPKANTPLIVDTDTKVAAPVSMKRLQPVARRNFQIIQCHGAMQHAQFSECDAMNVWRYLSGRLPVKDSLRFPASKGTYHTESL
jgi:hypothetical protein